MKDALAFASTLTDLTSYAQPGPGKPENKIFRELFEGRRNPVFHAKTSRQPILPGEELDRTKVVESHRRLTGLYLVLAKHHLGLKRPFSSYFSLRFNQMLIGDLDLKIYVSDLMEFPSDENAVAESIEKRVVPLTTQRSKSLDGAFLTSFLGKTPVSRLTQLPRISQIWIEGGNDKPVPYAFLEGEGLTLDGIDHFEVHLGFRHTQPHWPKEVFTR